MAYSITYKDLEFLRKVAAKLNKPLTIDAWITLEATANRCSVAEIENRCRTLWAESCFESN